MQILTKIYLFCFSLICVFCFIFSFSVYQQEKIINEIEHIIEKDIKIIENIADLTIYQLEFSIHLEQIRRRALEQRISKKQSAMLASDIFFKDEYLDKYKSLLANIQRNIITANAQAYHRKSEREFAILKNKIKKIGKLHANYIIVAQDMLNLLQDGNIEDLVLYETTFKTLEDNIIYGLESMLSQIQFFTAKSVEEIRHHESQILKFYIFSGGLLLILICLFLTVIIIKIKRSIQKAVQFAENIEAGNRQFPTTPPGKDEIGRIVHAMEFMLRAITKAEDELKRIALTDSLTCIANRLMFNTALKKEVERAKRYKQPLSLIMFDIDHFKNFNDTYGHDAGDSILIELTRLIRKNIRTVDLLARWGGEEFMILSSSTKIDKAIILAEKLREIIENHNFSETRKVTCSFGLAEYLSEDIETFLKRVDIALYQSKESGRNKITTAKTPQ